MPYKIKDHQSFGDLEVEIIGGSADEVFIDAAKALVSAMIDVKGLKSKQTETVELSNSTPERLLFDWLEELIVLKDSKRFLAKKILVDVAEDKKQKMWTLVATLEGDLLDPIKHELHYDVKAVTLHNFSLKKSTKGWKANVLFDL